MLIIFGRVDTSSCSGTRHGSRCGVGGERGHELKLKIGWWWACVTFLATRSTDWLNRAASLSPLQDTKETECWLLLVQRCMISTINPNRDCEWLGTCLEESGCSSLAMEQEDKYICFWSSDHLSTTYRIESDFFSSSPFIPPSSFPFAVAFTPCIVSIPYAMQCGANKGDWKDKRKRKKPCVGERANKRPSRWWQVMRMIGCLTPLTSLLERVGVEFNVKNKVTNDAMQCNAMWCDVMRCRFSRKRKGRHFFFSLKWVERG